MTEQAAYLCVDTETTGLEPEHCAMVEIGAIALNKRLRPLEGKSATLNLTLRPDKRVHEIQAKAIQINGHKWVYNENSQEWKDALPYEEAREVFHDFIVSHFPKPKFIVMVGWNVGFDERFLKAMYAYQGESNVSYGWPFHYHKLDLLAICRYLDLRAGRPPRKSYSLEALSKAYFGDGMAKFAAHTAMGDAQMCLKVLEAMENDV